MIRWSILVGFVLLEALLVLSDLGSRKKAKQLFGQDYAAELKKSSTFGSFFFWQAMAALTVAVIFVISGEFIIGGVLLLAAFVLWYMGFRHDRPKLDAFYENRQDAKTGQEQ